MKLSRTSVSLGSGAILVAAVLVYQSMLPKEMAVSDLIKQKDILNSRCRDGRADTEAAFAATQRICDQREKLITKLKSQGWCYGTEEQAQYEKQWQPCEQKIISKPQPVASDEIQFNQNAANNKIMLSNMGSGTAACSADLMRGLLRQGIRSRSQLLRSASGICGQGIKRFLIMQKVPPSAADKYVEAILVEVLDDVLR